MYPNECKRCFRPKHYGLPYRLTRNWDEWGGRCDEDTIADLVGATMPQIVQDRLSDFLWEWQSRLASTFARHDKRSFLPKQIAKFQCAHIASAQTKTRDQQQN